MDGKSHGEECFMSCLVNLFRVRGSRKTRPRDEFVMPECWCIFFGRKKHREDGTAVTHNTSKERDVINSAWGDDRQHADRASRGLSSFRSKITRGCIPDREGRKKHAFILPSRLPSSRFFSLVRSQVLSRTSFTASFLPPNSFTFLFLCLFLSLSLSLLLSRLSIGFTQHLFAKSATRCFMLIRWLRLDTRLLSRFHFENWVGVQVLEHQSVM